MHPKLRREDIDDLIKKVRSLLAVAAQTDSEVTSQVLSARTHQALVEIYEQLESSGIKIGRSDADLGNAARICAYYAESAKVLHDELSLEAAQDVQLRDGLALSAQIVNLFSSLAYSAASLSRSKAHLQLYAYRDEAAALWRDGMTESEELKQLFDATVRRYEQGSWRTAAQAARKITPEIVELAASFANRRAGRSLLRPGTNKPLEWIRRHRRCKV